MGGTSHFATGEGRPRPQSIAVEDILPFVTDREALVSALNERRKKHLETEGRGSARFLLFSHGEREYYFPQTELKAPRGGAPRKLVI